MYGLIYLITCLVTGKKYVGQTTRSIAERFKEHASHNKYFIGRAIRKYGRENFMIETLEVCATKEQLEERERHWIAYYNCIAPKGYNLTDGGEGGWHHTLESRAKLSAANSGANHPMFGKHHTDSAIAKISAASKGRHHTEASKAKLSAAQTTKHAVICIETGEIFDSVAAAARHYKANRANIILACKEHQRTVAGVHIWYLEDYNATTEIVIPPPKTKPQKRKVVCLETGEVFPTIRQAAEWLGMVHGAVSRACRIHYAAGGYYFRYYDEV